MNYYERHIGDYLKDTAHLSLLEHGIYTRLMDVYYTREAAIPQEQAARLIGARSKEEREALDAVLAEFFESTPDGWKQERCNREIERYQDKQTKAKRSANARWGAKPTHSEGNATASADAMRTHSEGNATASADAMRTHSEGNAPRARPQTPDTKHQTQLIPEAKASSSAEGPPPCPHQRLLDLFAELVPELPQPRRELWEGGKGAEAMRQRWRWLLTAKRSSNGQRYATTEDEGIEWFRRFFEQVAVSDFLTGRSGVWRNCDLTWLMGRENFSKVVQGNYANHEGSAA